MSYSKYHYLMDAVHSLNKTMQENKVDLTLRFNDDFHQIFALAYLCYYFSENSLDYNCSIEEAINKIENSSETKVIISNNLSSFLSQDFTHFKNVPSTEAKTYMFNFYETLTARDKYPVGETPWEICNLACQLLEIKETDTVADLCYGIGNFASSLLENYEVKSVTGYEINIDVTNMAKILNEVRKHDVTLKMTNVLLENNNEKYSKIFCDAPFRMSLDSLPNFKYYADKIGIKSPKGLKSEYAFIQKALDCLTEDGKAIVFVPLITLREKDIFTKYLVENKYINTVIQFADNLLPGTAIPFAMLVLSFNNEKIKMIDATDIFTKSRFRNILSTDNISDIVNAYYEESDISKVISLENIKDNNYDINPYVYFYSTEIPTTEKNYAYEPLMNLCSIKRGVQYKAKELDEKETLAPTNCYYLTSNGIQNNQIIISELPHLTDIEEKNKEYCLQENDILIPVIKSNPLKIAMATDLDNRQIIASSNLFIIRINSDKLNPIYLKAVLEKEQTLKRINIYTMGLSNISAEILNKLVIPVPPMEKQLEIAEKYMEYQNQIDMHRKQVICLENNKAAFINNL